MLTSLQKVFIHHLIHVRLNIYLIQQLDNLFLLRCIQTRRIHAKHPHIALVEESLFIGHLLGQLQHCARGFEILHQLLALQGLRKAEQHTPGRRFGNRALGGGAESAPEAVQDAEALLGTVLEVGLQEEGEVVIAEEGEGAGRDR